MDTARLLSFLALGYDRRRPGSIGQLAYGSQLNPSGIEAAETPYAASIEIQVAFARRGTQTPGTLDCAAAIENLMIAAPALGLGTVWIGDFDPPKVCALLGIPELVAVISLVYLGYPAEEKPPRTQYDPANVYWQEYS